MLQETAGLLPGGPVWCWAVLGGDKHPQRGHGGARVVFCLHQARIEPHFNPRTEGEHAIGEAAVPGQMWEGREILLALPGRKG